MRFTFCCASFAATSSSLTLGLAASAVTFRSGSKIALFTTGVGAETLLTLDTLAVVLAAGALVAELFVATLVTFASEDAAMLLVVGLAAVLVEVVTEFVCSGLALRLGSAEASEAEAVGCDLFGCLPFLFFLLLDFFDCPLFLAAVLVNSPASI